MKAVKKIFLFLILSIFASCGMSGFQDQDAIVIDESFSLGINAEVINEGLKERATSILLFPGVGKVAIVPNLLVVDVIDDTGLGALLQKYGASSVEDPAIELFPTRTLTEEGLEEGPSTEKIIEIHPLGSPDVFFKSFALNNKMSLPVTVNNQQTSDFLNWMARLRLEDSKKIRDFRPAIYAVEFEGGGPREKTWPHPLGPNAPVCRKTPTIRRNWTLDSELRGMMNNVSRRSTIHL